MKKAYCFINDFKKEAIDIILKSGIELTFNNKKEIPNENELISIIKNYDIIIISVAIKLSSKLLKYINSQKIIATVSVGVDHIDKSFFDSPLISIIHINKSNAISVAEHIFSLILALNKRLIEANILTINGNGNKNAIHERAEDISGKTLGLIGCGNISQEVIKIASIFNMKINCYTKDLNKYKNLSLCKNVNFMSLDEVLQSSDIINVCIPLNEETKNIISREKIKLLKKNSTFINTSRTEIVDNYALMEYADKYNTFYVGLDIDIDNYKDLFSKERNNVIITPHIAGTTKQAIDRMDTEIANKIVGLINKYKGGN